MRSTFVIFLIVAFCHGQALAQQSSDTLDVRASVVQCGAYDDLPESCVYDDRCCPLKEQFYDETLAQAKTQKEPDAVDLALQTPIVIAQAQFLGLKAK
jgi:hypothetical protein